MTPKTLETKEKNTWCPGCPNFIILEAFKEAVSELAGENKIKIKDAVVACGIGCHGKIFDYLNLSGIYCLHGRLLPTAIGIKLSNPGLTVFGFGGDGDTFAEGIEHFIHACRYNVNLKMLVHNNQVFALTVGQVTPTSEKGFVGSANFQGKKEEPLNPLVLALASGATFVARAYALDKAHLKDLIRRAVEHKGFAFIDILQPCIVFHNTVPYFQKNIYKLDQNHNSVDLNSALEKAKEWDYCFDRAQKIPIGVFYKTEKPCLEDGFPQEKVWHKVKRNSEWKKLIEKF